MKQNKSALFYYIGIFLLIFCSLASWSGVIIIPTKINYGLLGIFSFCLLINFLSQGYSLKNYVVILIIGCLSVYTSYKLDNILFMTNFLAIVSIKNVSFDKVVKIDFYTKLGFILLHLLVYIVGQFDQNIGIIDIITFSGNTGYRNSLFFPGPNALALIVFFLIIDYLYINRNNQLYLKSILCLIPLYITFIFTKSRTFLIVYALLLLFLWIDKLLKKRVLKLYNFICKYIPEILFLLIFSVVSNYGIFLSKLQVVTTQINILLSGRLSYSAKAYDYYGLHIFGNPDSINIGDKFIVDNFYVRCIVSYGIIIFIIISILSKIATKKATQFEKILIMIMYVYLFSEIFPFDVGKSVIPLMIGYLLYKKESDINENK